MIPGTLQNRAELPDCSSVPKRQTWIPHNTSGFFYKGQWQPTFCNLPGDHKYSQCLRGKHFRFFGDSTIRQWYKYMMEYLNCSQMTEKWSERAWHKRTLCYSSTMNFTAEWIPHGQPFYVGNHWDTRRYTTHPISAYLNEVSDNSKLILVVHIFSHYSNFRSEIFLDRMKVISKSAKHLLERAKNVMVLVKGPHTINQVRGYWYYHYRAIMKKEFEALQDRVVFMEQGDMTIAKRNEPIHPEIDILKEAVRQLIGYTC